MERINKRCINGVDVYTHSKEISSANILEVEAGTTGFCGGDTGHGGRTYLRIKDLGGTDIKSVSSEQGVEILLGGDTELQTICEALQFILDTIEKDITTQKVLTDRQLYEESLRLERK